MNITMQMRSPCLSAHMDGSRTACGRHAIRAHGPRAGRALPFTRVSMQRGGLATCRAASDEAGCSGSRPSDGAMPLVQRLRHGAAAALKTGALVATLLSPMAAQAYTPAALFGGSTLTAPREAPSIQENKQPEPSDLTPEEQQSVHIFKENTPAVVNIANIATKRAYLSTDLLRLPQGQGSGFLWDDQGHVVTNYHVIRGASEVRVTLIDQSVYSARLVGGDPSRDIAVLQLDAPPASLAALKAVEVGKSSGLAVGQKVYAIGNPFGLDHTLTSGIISGLNRELGAGTNNGPSLRNVIQTDAAINPGNSGGPLLDSKGRLIGINTAIADPTGKGASSGIGFAIPIDACRGLVDQILTYGRVVRPMLGITLAPPQALRQLGLSGVLVLDVPPGGPADAAGVKGTMRDGFGRVVLGDVIVGVNGRKVANEGDLFDALDSCKVGDEVRLDILSGGRTKASLSIVLAERAARVTE
uniref:PDZ domain-containing protein n=1 Tax=Auxenochlorella protothecoides TaxID=3075 RepID=A0A1D1ZZT2_AUXPR